MPPLFLECGAYCEALERDKLSIVRKPGMSLAPLKPTPLQLSPTPNCIELAQFTHPESSACILTLTSLQGKTCYANPDTAVLLVPAQGGLEVFMILFSHSTVGPDMATPTPIPVP